MKLFTIAGVLCLSSFISTHTLAVCKDDIEKSTPSADFSVHNDGTVTHHRTGLMWKSCVEGKEWAAETGTCTENSGNYTWKAALALPASVNTNGGYAGHTDWRLPNIKELQTIVDYACYNPAINVVIFPETPSGDNHYHWSSSPAISESSKAWTLRFVQGIFYTRDRSEQNPVRLVRDAP
jgi:hypothetical protein